MAKANNEPKPKKPAPKAEPKSAENTAAEAEAVETVNYEALYNEAKGAQDELNEYKDKYVRLLAEYDNYRKRSQKDREGIYTDVRAATVSELLPVYDNLERAVNQPTEDTAYSKGVELTMAQFKEILANLKVEIYGQAGDAFDPTLHNGVMHVEDETLGENVIAEVFQKGFKIGEKVIRFAMVKVAN